MEFFHGVHLHVAAVGAGAVLGGAGDEDLLRALAPQPVQHPALRGDDECPRRMTAAKVDHLLGAAHFVREQAHGEGAFRVRHHRRVRMRGLDLQNTVARELDMDVTRALPEVHLPARLQASPGGRSMCTHPGISTRAWESRYRGERAVSDGVYTES